MAFSKKQEFTEEDTWLADISKALSHPAEDKDSQNPEQYECMHVWRHR